MSEETSEMEEEVKGESRGQKPKHGRKPSKIIKKVHGPPIGKNAMNLPRAEIKVDLSTLVL